MYAILIGLSLMLSLIFYHVFPSVLSYYSPCYSGIITNYIFIILSSIPLTECFSLSPFSRRKYTKNKAKMACISPVSFSLFFFFFFSRDILENILISTLTSFFEKIRTAWLLLERLKSGRK